MFQKSVSLITALMLCGILIAAEIPSAGAAAGEEEAGFALLKSLVASFTDMARGGSGGYEVVNQALQRQMASLKQARLESQVDPIFFRRYHRMLVILKLAVVETDYDREGIMNDFITDQLESFIIDVTGEAADLGSVEEGKGRGIGVIAGAIAEELLNLHIHLDNKRNRKQLLEKYFQWTK